MAKTRLETYWEIEADMTIRRRRKEITDEIPKFCGCGCTSFDEVCMGTFECKKCGKLWEVKSEKI